MSRICIGCGIEIHPKRVEILPHTKTCVKCSTTEKKGGMIIQLGEGDHTCTEIMIMDREELNIIEDIQKSHKKLSSGNLKKEIIEEEQNEDDDLSSLRIVDNNTDEDDDSDEDEDTNTDENEL